MTDGMVGLLVAAMTLTGALTTQPAASAVRPETDVLRTLVATGVERSATFKELVTRLDASDVVVYVRFSKCNGDVPACLLWAEPGLAVRHLVIRVNRAGLSEESLIGLLAHELQHAGEVASDARIKDPASFRLAFQGRGWKTPTGYETQEAHEVTRQVRKELFAYRATAHVRGGGRL